MTIEVIGAGTGRTGTMSLKLALEQLGFGPCYHMIELLQEPARVAHWEAAFGGRPVDWDAALAGYRSTVDFPSYLHYRALMRQYPEAKVILTLRDPESWYESALTTIYRAKPGLGGMLRMAVRLPFSRFHRQLIRVFKLSDSIWRDEFGGRFTDRAYAIEVYNRHLAEVRSHVPRERLLEFDVKQGWAPLCAFLGVAAPDGPFPRANDRAEFQARLRLGIDKSLAKLRAERAANARR
ncbi:MAG: sulfotransferase family protein [Myxococcales bacterium]|nr:sulfotransferase family protein [Myxococcales bacterium]